MKFINNVRGAFASNEAADQGSLVETVLIIAGFAVVAILVVTWIGNAIAGQAANVSACIAGANASEASELEETCTEDTYDVKNSVDNTIQDQKGGRFD
jgi:hypothetical protein